MKKFTRQILVAAAIIIVVLLVAAAMCIDGVVRDGVQRIGSSAAQVDVRLGGVDLSFLSPGVRLKGLVIANPQGYKTPEAINVGLVSVRVEAGTAFSHKLVVDSIQLESPVVTIEGGMTGNNLRKIEKNIDDYMGAAGGATPAANSDASKQGRRLEVKELAITGAKVQVNNLLSGGQTVTLPLPDIHLSNLGDGPDGITAADLAKKTLAVIEETSLKSMASSLGRLEKEGSGGAGKVFNGVKKIFGQ